MRAVRAVLASIAGVVLAAGPAPAGDGDASPECEDGVVEHEVTVGGVLAAVDGRRLTVGDTRVVLPRGPLDVAWCRSEDDPVRWEDDTLLTGFRVGDVVSASGTLQPDGSVLAYWVEPTGPDVPWRTGDVASGADAGVVTRVDDALRDGAFWLDPTGRATFDVDGIPYAADFHGVTTDDWDRGFRLAGTTWSGLAELLPGDAVGVEWGEDADGVRHAYWTYVRRAGEGCRLQGTIDAVTVDGNGWGTLVLDGVACALGEHTDAGAAPSMNADSYRDPWEHVAPGNAAVVHGTLREGRVLADRVYVYSDNPQLEALAGKVRLNGVVDAVRPGGLTVCGLDATLRGADRAAKPGRRTPRTPRVRPGTRIRVDGRTTPSGGVVADRIRLR